jgi:HAMP domain-containing protein
LRAAAVYDSNGDRLAQLQQGDKLKLPERFKNVETWRLIEFRNTQLISIPKAGKESGHLLLVASSELPTAFYTGTFTASAGILVFSVLLWLVVARQIRRLITEPIYQLEELSRQVTREEDYALRAEPGNNDEIGSLAEAFNTMLSRIEAREQQLKRARDDSHDAYSQAQGMAEEARHTNRKLELEVQVRSKIEKKLTGFQNYLNSIIDSMPSALIALDEQLYVTQRPLRHHIGRSAKPADFSRVPSDESIFTEDQTHGRTAHRYQDRSRDLGQGRYASPLRTDLLSIDRWCWPRSGDPH